MIGSSLIRFRTDPFLLLDTEGESLSLGFARPWQVSWAIATLKGGIEKVTTRYIHFADLDVSAEAAVKTRFDKDKYAKEALPANEVLSELNADLYSDAYRIIWQNGLGYDYWVHCNWMRACGHKPNDSYLTRTIDTHAILKARKKGWTPDITNPESFLRWQYQAVGYVEKGLKTNLTEVGHEMKIEHDYATTHDAESDIRLMFKVFQKAVYDVEF